LLRNRIHRFQVDMQFRDDLGLTEKLAPLTEVDFATENVF
jgi:hypothetical protein